MKRTVLIAVVFVVLVLLVRTVMPLRENPLDAVRAAAIEMGGWAEGELALLEGGYESAFVGMTARGRFTVQSGRNQGSTVHVEVVRPSPLQDWRLVEYQVTSAETPAEH